MNWKKWTGVAAFLAVLIFIGYSIYSSTQEEQLPVVQTTEVTENNLTELISTTGVIEPSQTQEVAGQGAVDELNVAVGDTVEEGETLVTYADEFGTSFDANFDGTVTEINVAEGEMDNNAQQGQPSLVVSDLNDLQVSIRFSRSDAGAIEVDQAVTFSYSDQEYEGTVSEIDPVATQEDNAGMSSMGGGTSGPTLGAVLSFNSEPENLIAGFEIDADITINSVENALTLPIESLHYDSENNPYVFTVENGVAHEREITTGIQSNTDIEITEGLEEGEAIITSSIEEIEDGTEVEVEAE